MRPIRLAFLGGRLKFGGAELQMLELARRLPRDLFDVEFVSLSGAGPLDERARVMGASVKVIGEVSSSATPRRTRIGRRLSRHARWVATARRARYDIVDAWLYPTDVVAAVSRPLTRVPVVASARLDLLPRIGVGSATPIVESSLTRLVDVVVANAAVTAAEAIRQRVPPEKVRIIRGGVEMPRTFGDDERRAQRARMGAGDADLLIGCVGTFRSMKRQDLLVDAFARLLPDHPELRLAFVGDGDRRASVERRIERLGLSDRVTMVGTATDVQPLYDAFDLFVQASNSEALPNVLLEASASGTAIVATAAGGSGELIRDGETGLLVPVDDLDRLAAAIETAVSDPTLRMRLGAAAHEHVAREYGMDRFASEYADLYQELLARKVLSHPMTARRPDA